MRVLPGALALLIAAPALAQSADDVGRRVGKLESEMKAVQRKVFPGADSRYFEPEVAPPAPAAAEPVGNAASAPLTDLTARVGELEGQLRTLTGQVEANANRLRLLDEALTKFRGDAEFRLGALEGGREPTPPSVESLELRELDLAAGGARATASGVVTFDAQTRPTGGGTARVEGLDRVLDALVALGAVSPEDARDARLGIAVYFRPGGAPDTRETTVEIAPDGMVTMNGMPLPMQ